MTLTLYFIFIVVCLGFCSLAYMLYLVMKAIDSVGQDVVAIAYHIQAKEWINGINSGEFYGRFPIQKE